MSIRFVVGPSRSGTGAFLRSFENNPFVNRVLYQPIKSAIRDTGSPRYDFIDTDQDNHIVTVAKDTIGIGASGYPIAEATYRVFRNASDLNKARYIFLFRNPLYSYSSDHNKFGVDLNSFLIGYRSAYEQAIAARKLSRNVSILTLEKLGMHPKEVFQLVCLRWDIPYTDSMIHWELPVGKKLVVSSGEMVRLEGVLSPSLEGLNGKDFSYVPCEENQLQLTQEEHDQITKHMLPLFQELEKKADADFPVKKGHSNLT